MAKPPPLSKSKPTPVDVHDAIVLLEADPGQLHAALRIARFLIAEDRPFSAADAAARLVDAFVHRGDLPRAVLAAIAADEGTSAEDPFQKIADAFGEGSGRLTDASAAPPPLPKRVSVPAKVAKLRGEGLLDRAEAALSSFLEWEDDVDTEAGLPFLPLFSDLQPAALVKLLHAFTAQTVRTDEVLIEEGDEGTNAFVVADGVLEVSREAEERVVLAALGPGALFGEMALVSDAPRAARVSATSPAIVLAVSRADLEELAVETPEIGQRLGEFCRGRMLSNLMRHSDLFRAVPAEDRNALIGHFETAYFDPSDVLIEADKEGDSLFLIASGTVAVDGKDASGGAVRIAELGPGQVVGEISLVLRRPANAEVYAIHPTVALQLGRDAFQDAIKAHPTLLGELYEMATGREEETRTLIAQESLDAEDVVLI